MMNRVPPSPFARKSCFRRAGTPLPRVGKSLFYQVKSEQRTDKRGRTYCVEKGEGIVSCSTGVAAPKNPTVLEAEAEGKPAKKRKAKAPVGYGGDPLPKLEPDREPLLSLSAEDWGMLTRLGVTLKKEEDRQGFAEHGMLGWGPVQIDEDRLREYFPPEEIQHLLDEGWIGNDTNTADGSNFRLYRKARILQTAKLEDIYEIRPPRTLVEAKRLAQVVEKGNLDHDVLEYLGLSNISRKEILPVLEEMLYRYYNPVPVWERVKKDKVLQKKVKELAEAPMREADLAVKRSGLTREIRKLDEEVRQLSQQHQELAHRLYGATPLSEDEKAKVMRGMEDWATKMDELFRKSADLEGQRSKIRQRQREETTGKILKVKNPTPVDASLFQESHSEAERKAVQDAASWLTGKVAEGPNRGWLPAYTILKDNEPTTGRKGPSAYYRESVHGINVHDGMVSVATNVHEMAHGIEYKMPGAQTAAQRFLMHRVGDEPLRKLREVCPSCDYGEWEEGREDEFAKAFGKHGSWYVGKAYNSGATEVVSMGVERLYESPSTFAQEDPEFCAFILGILDGRARDVPVPRG